MDFKNLESFIKITELGSFAKAAESLGYAQSTITAQIHNLEQELGYPLFEKIGRRNALTPAGYQLVTYVRQILLLEDEILQLRDIAPEDIRGTLRIGTIESVLNTIIINIIDQYSEKFPKINITIKTAHSAKLQEMLHSNEVDIIFCLSESATIPGFICAGSRRERIVFFAHRDHPLSQKQDLSVKDICNYNFITLTNENYLQQELLRLASGLGTELKSTLTVQSSQLTIRFVENNVGIGFLPESQVRASANLDEIRILEPIDYGFSYMMRIFYHKDKLLTKPMEALFRIVTDYVNTQETGK